MEYTKTKELFNRYNSHTIDSVEVLLDYIEEPVLRKVIKELSKQKYEEDREEYEGRNEFDSITRILSFDLSEIEEKFYKLDDEEANYLKTISIETSKKLNEKDYREENLKTKLEKFSDDCNRYIMELHQEAPGPIPDDELEEFFEKYDAVSLMAFDKIFENVIKYNMSNSRAIKKIVLQRKIVEMRINDETIPENYEISVEKISKRTEELVKNKELTENEAYYLSDIVEDAAMFLECRASTYEEDGVIYEPDDTYEYEPTLTYLQEFEELMYVSVDKAVPVQKVKK
jgi:hypothetical protein